MTCKTTPHTLTCDSRIGWIGTGVMGSSMCGHLMAAGYSMSVYTRTKNKADSLVANGATWRNSPQEVATHSDIVFSIVGFPDDVRKVYLGTKGLLARATAGTILVDMTTTEPSLAVEIHDRASCDGAFSVDAPVSGGDVGAKNATLSIMVGGDEPAVSAVKPLLEIMGKSVIFQGPAGAGQHTKMCNQIMIASTMIGMCESLLYGFKAGLDLETMLQSISGGAAGCWSLDNYAPRILKRDFDPGFFVEHFIKDMGIALREAERINLSLPGLALAHQLYVALNAQGHGKKGTQALILALEQMSAISI